MGLQNIWKIAVLRFLLSQWNLDVCPYIAAYHVTHAKCEMFLWILYYKHVINNCYNPVEKLSLPTRWVH